MSPTSVSSFIFHLLVVYGLTYSSIYHPYVFAANFTVLVGGLPANGSTSPRDQITLFNPDHVMAQPGDSVIFVIRPLNHSLSESTFEKPCEVKQGGFDSGFIPVPATVVNETEFPHYKLSIVSMDPIWMFCRSLSHCARGMVFAINPPNATALQAFKDGTKQYNIMSEAPLPTAPLIAGDPQDGVQLSTGTFAPETATVLVAGQFQTLTYGSYPGSASPTSAVSSDHMVDVSGSDQLSFVPPLLDAQPGDTVTFRFLEGNYSVTQSSFTSPCVSLTSSTDGEQVGFDSGPMPILSEGTTQNYTIRVNDTNPFFAFAQTSQELELGTDPCHAGMVFAANTVESSTTNYLAFQSNALLLDSSEHPIGQAGNSSNTSIPTTSSALALPSQSRFEMLSFATLAYIFLVIF
ncbi:hypothetical protein EIP91_002643 [Steccherinum ochraceum]|uniref:Cupredoxin n=1 Tax=Steccherinum ochraceum TaxID=92696 RepID=A0A4R0RTC0_9APHY|nr:hypothetical protein EIP91_002643 [Steccherinum ochraceum]